MKHYVNKDKITEAYIREPYTIDSDLPFGNSHGWQVVLIVGYGEGGFPINITLNKDSESDCIDTINKFDLTPIG